MLIQKDFHLLTHSDFPMEIRTDSLKHSDLMKETLRGFPMETHLDSHLEILMHFLTEIPKVIQKLMDLMMDSLTEIQMDSQINFLTEILMVTH